MGLGRARQRFGPGIILWRRQNATNNTNALRKYYFYRFALERSATLMDRQEYVNGNSHPITQRLHGAHDLW
jgi:hypothetical protein